MLLEFKASNYKSFADEFTLSMIPAPKQSGLDYSILKERIGNKEYKALCSTVIYGPNASGKSNIISALDVFKEIVLRGNIRNNDKINSPNTAASMLELIPNIDYKENHPTTFSISFSIEGFLINYSLSVLLSTITNRDNTRKIIEEILHVNNKLIFYRNSEIKFGQFDIIKDMVNESFYENKEAVITLANRNLIEDELFLVNIFRLMISKELVSLIMHWFKFNLDVIYNANAVKTAPSDISIRNNDSSESKIILVNAINDAIDCFGSSFSKLGYMARDNGKVDLVSIFPDKIPNLSISANSFESYGTIRFANLVPMIIDALKHGGTLVIDEFDASIHPMALINIVNIFHNDEINKNHAQLIFNTHNPMFLNPSVFRRDEIKFTERDEESNKSELYSLSDFGTSSETGVRKNDDYMKHYFLGRYGAIKDINFSSFFKKVVEATDEEE
jgi:AAA15 family ATPase/GTPase